MNYPNLQAAWLVLLMDNVPDQRSRPMPDLPFPADQLKELDEAIGDIRQTDDLTNINSPLWNLMAGNDPTPNDILQWMFDQL
jgi:hypothetical protein